MTVRPATGRRAPTGRGPARWRPLAVFVLVLVVLFVAVDRIAAAVADRLIADKLQAAEHLRSRPDVTVRGFPLLSQVIRQRYREVDVRMSDLRRGSLVATRLDVRMHGLHVRNSDLLSGHVGRIRVDKATGTVLLSWPDIAGMTRGHGVTVGYGGKGLLSLRGSFAVAGRMFTVSGTAALRINGSDLVVAPRQIHTYAPGFVNDALSSIAAQRLSFDVPLAGLPFNVRLVGVTVRRDGVVVSARSDGLVIDLSS
jgi:hypothetical protein